MVSQSSRAVRVRLSAVIALVVAFAAGGVVGSGGGAAAATVIELPAGIDATGGADVTNALNVAIAAAPDGSTIRFAANGRYRIEGTVLVDRKRDLTLDGNGAALIAETDGSGVPVDRRLRRGRWPRTRDHLRIRSSVGVRVADLTVRGPNRSGEFVAELEAQAAVLVTRSARVELDRMTMRTVFGDGVYVTGASRSVVVRDCEMTRIGRQGVAVVSGEQVEVVGCQFDAVARSVVDLEPMRGLAREISVHDNRVGEYGNFLLAAVGALDGVGEVTVRDNRVDGGRGVSVYAGTKHTVRTGLRIVDNVGTGVSEGYEGALIRVERFDGVEIRGNRQRVAPGVTPVLLVNSCSTTVADNVFGATVAESRSDGDCRAPGVRVPPARRSTPAAGPRDGGNAGGDVRRAPAGAGGRRSSGGGTARSTRVVTRTVVVHEEGASSMALAGAVAAAALAGGLGVGLWCRAPRSGREEESETDGPD